MKVSLLAGVVFFATGGLLSAQTVELFHNGKLQKVELINGGVKECQEFSKNDHSMVLRGKCQLTFRNDHNQEET
ncbi:MAG TPA: hypothetical protein DCQ68_05945, partial [Chryseobacterium indologenes]|nr:hypothetical protein [Chryseobacterium indologenes]